VTELRTLTEVVANLYGTRRQCIQAVALFVRTAELLGHRVTPRAVSLAVILGPVVATLGKRALDVERLPELSTADAETIADSGWLHGGGHMVAILDQPPYLFDPTLQQLGARLDIELGPLAQPIGSVEPADGGWDLAAASGEMVLRYYLVPEETAWKRPYDTAFDGQANLAADIANRIRATRVR